MSVEGQEIRPPETNTEKLLFEHLGLERSIGRLRNYIKEEKEESDDPDNYEKEFKDINARALDVRKGIIALDQRVRLLPRISEQQFLERAHAAIEAAVESFTSEDIDGDPEGFGLYEAALAYAETKLREIEGEGK